MGDTLVHKQARQGAGRAAPLRSKYLNAQYSSSLTRCLGFFSFFSSASSMPFSTTASSLPSLLASCSAGCSVQHTGLAPKLRMSQFQALATCSRATLRACLVPKPCALQHCWQWAGEAHEEAPTWAAGASAIFTSPFATPAAGSSAGVAAASAAPAALEGVPPSASASSSSSAAASWACHSTGLA